MAVLWDPYCTTGSPMTQDTSERQTPLLRAVSLNFYIPNKARTNGKVVPVHTISAGGVEV